MPDADDDEQRWSATRVWVEKALQDGERIESAERLRGGWTSRMRLLHVAGPHGRRSLVLRSFVKPFYVRHAQGLLSREADILALLGGTDVPAAECVAVDARGEHCDHPSLLMSLLPGEIRLDDVGARERIELLARQLVGIHRVRVTDRTRPRDYQAWIAPEQVRAPESTDRLLLWRQAVDVIRRDPPAYRPRFLHRDFHPGNVLFTGDGADVRVSGVVDWVETSWGPPDLDVAHCSTTLALLHGVTAGMSVTDEYVSAGGHLSADPVDHLYWRLLDALAYAPDADRLAVPWRELGRVDLTAGVLAGRLEDYIQACVDRFG